MHFCMYVCLHIYEYSCIGLCACIHTLQNLSTQQVLYVCGYITHIYVYVFIHFWCCALSYAYTCVPMCIHCNGYVHGLRHKVWGANMFGCIMVVFVCVYAWIHARIATHMLVCTSIHICIFVLLNTRVPPLHTAGDLRRMFSE